MELIEESEENSGESRGSFTPHHLELKIIKQVDKEIKNIIIQNKKNISSKVYYEH